MLGLCDPVEQAFFKVDDDDEVRVDDVFFDDSSRDLGATEDVELVRSP